MKKLTTILMTFASLGYAHSQGLYVEGGSLYVEPATTIYTEGNVELGTSGTIDNSGTIQLTSNWINNSGTTGLINASTGLVDMISTNHQIDGADVTNFYNLTFSGGFSLVEQFVSANVQNQLDIIDAELQTNEFLMNITNPNPTSLMWSQGFVSSANLGGYLVRSMNSTSEYQFPVGDAAISNVYRAVSITPNSADSGAFGVRFANQDPGQDNSGVSFTGAVGPFDRSVTAPAVAQVNDNYYHNIARMSGSMSADVDIFHFSADGNFENVAQWDNMNTEWFPRAFFINDNNGNPEYGNPDKVGQMTILDDFEYDVYAFISDFNLTVPQVFTPNNDGINDYFEIPGIRMFPNNKLQVFNRWGSLVYEKEGYVNEWDGRSLNGIDLELTLDGEILPSATYFYILDLGVDGVNPITGYVELLTE